MNHDPLESELQSIAPKPLSADFMPRVQARLAPAHTTHWPARLLLLTALAAAACVAITTLVLRMPRTPHWEFVTPGPTQAATPDPLTSLAQFEHAYQQSPQALDALLQQRPVGPSQQQAARAYDVTRIDLN